MKFALSAEEVTRACGDYIQRREGFTGSFLVSIDYQASSDDLVVFVKFTKQEEQNEKVDQGSARGSQSARQSTLGGAEETEHGERIRAT